MATDAQSLLTLASPYSGYASNDYMLSLIRIGLLLQILKSSNPVAATDANTLLNLSKCYACNSASGYSLQLIELGLLQQIVTGGGIGGNVNFGISQGSVAPSGAPAQPNWLYYADVNHTDNPGVWLWNSTTNRWDEIIAPG